MNRRAFLGTMLGAGAAVALPSEVWPFRKIFLPTFKRWFAFDRGFEILNPALPPTVASNMVNCSVVEAIQLEQFEKQLPDLIFKAQPMWSYIKNRPLRDYRYYVNLSEFVAARSEYPGPRFTNIEMPANNIPLLNRAGIFPDEPEEWTHIPEKNPLDMLHAKATPENIERWIDDLIPKSQG